LKNQGQCKRMVTEVCCGNGTIIVVISTIIALCISATIFVSIQILFYLMARRKKKNKKNSGRIARIKKYFLKSEIYFALFATALIVLLFVFFSILRLRNNESDFLQGIQVEFFGMIFEVLILFVLFGWFNNQRQKQANISRMKEEINAKRLLKTEENKFRIRELIKLLNEEGERNIDLTHVDISESPNARFEYRFVKVKMTARFFESDLSYLIFEEGDFTGSMDDYGSKFIGAFLHEAIFRNVHLQGTKFDHAILIGADFSNSILTMDVSFQEADIRGINFSNCTIDSADFTYAQVSEGFILANSNLLIGGTPIGNLYNEVREPVPGFPGKFIWILEPRQGAQIITTVRQMFEEAFVIQEEGHEIIQKSAPVMNAEQAEKARQKFSELVLRYEELQEELLKPKYDAVRLIANRLNTDDGSKLISLDQARKSIRYQNRYIHGRQIISP